MSTEVGAQRQGIDKETDERLKLSVIAVGYRRPDDEVPLTTVAAHENLKGCEQCHVERGVVCLAQSAQTLRQVGIQRQCNHIATETLSWRSRPVGWKLQQFRCACQLRFPVVQLPLQALTLQILALPDGKVGILDGKGWQGCWLTLAERGIQGGQLAQQHARRPTVGRNVVQREQQELR